MTYTYTFEPRFDGQDAPHVTVRYDEWSGRIEWASNWLVLIDYVIDRGYAHDVYRGPNLYGHIDTYLDRTPDGDPVTLRTL